MKKATLSFLHRQRAELRADIGLLETGVREVIEIGPASRKNVTARVIQQLLERLGKFEELIAAFEAGIA